MQKIVGDRLRAEDVRDPEGVRLARAELEQTYALLNDRLEGRAWLAEETFSLAECSAAPALFYARSCTGGTSLVSPTSLPTTSASRRGRRSRG